MLTGFLRLLGLYPSKLTARDQAIQEALTVGLAFTGSFHDWEIPAGSSYAGEKLRTGPEQFSASCEGEFQRLLSLHVGRFKSRKTGKKLSYRRILTGDAPDLWIALDLKGVGVRGGPYRSRQGRAGYAMTGAKVSGSISLAPPGHPAYSRRFSGTVQPPNSIPDHRAWGGPPFTNAMQAAEIETVLKRLLGRFFDGP